MDIVTPLFDYFEVHDISSYSVGVGDTHTCLPENMGASRLANGAGSVQHFRRLGYAQRGELPSYVVICSNVF